MIIESKNKKLTIKWPIQILKFSMPLISNAFFGQFLLIIKSVYDCINGYSFASDDIKCRSGLAFYILASLGDIAIILLIFIALITNIFYYKIIFIKSNSDALKKMGCLPDVIFLLTKIGINLIFSMDKNNESDHWIIIFFMILFCGINAYFSLYCQNRINIILINLNKILCLALFSASLSLFLGKIFKSSKFNGLIILIPVLFVLISVFILFYKKQYTNIFLFEYNKINHPNEYLNYIYSFYFTFIKKNIRRNNNLEFKIAISTLEEKCIDKDCPLKIYSLNLKHLDNEYLLFHYCDKLFSYGLSKFYNNVNFMVNYICFLIIELNSQKKALILLNIMQENNALSLNNYIIHICKKLIDNSHNITEENHILDKYKNDIQKFRDLIKETIFLYYQFMLLLLECKIKNRSNFNKTNKIGTRITLLKKEIDKTFQKNKEFKTNNNQIIELYSEFNQIVLNSKDNYEKINYNDYIQNNELDYSNFNSHIYKEKDNDYLIISTDKNNIGEIIDCSINFCKMIGYQKQEIKGKNLNILIPPILQENHNLILKEYDKKYKLKFFENLINKKKYKPDFIKKEIYCLTKSKFLWPIKIKVYFSRTSENKFIYFLKINQDNPFSSNLALKEKISHSNEKCCILTDKNLFIKTFTPNCIDLLNINNKYINSKYCIINNIKEFQEDYLMAFNNINIDKSSLKDENKGDKSPGKKNKPLIIINESIKEKLIDKKYCRKNKITWQNNNEDNNGNLKNKLAKKNSIISNGTKNNKGSNLLILYKMNNDKDKKFNFFMEIKKIIINKQLLGYYFIFNKLNNNNDNNNSQNLNSTIDSTDIIKKLNLKIPNINSEGKNISTDNNSNSEINSVYENNEKANQNNSSRKEIKKQKCSSTVKYENDLLNINDNFIPKSSFNFNFNINNFYYEPSKNINFNRKLKEILKKEAMSKIQKYVEEINKNKSSSNNSDEFVNETSESIIDSESESKSSSSSVSNSSSQKPTENFHLNIKNKGFLKASTFFNKDNTNINKINNYSFDKVKTIKKTKTRNSAMYDNQNNSPIIKRNNKESEKNIKTVNYNYYKVNLKRIHFLSYDFNKEMIVENKNENISKIEKIMKNKNILRIGKDQMYPFIELNKNKNNMKDNNKPKSNDEKINFNNPEKNNEKLLENKIKEEINKKGDEIPIKKLKTISIFSYLFIIGFCILSLFLNLHYYSSMSKIVEIIKNIIRMKYCKYFGLYFMKELILLNYNAPNIYGGDYLLFPSHNITKYKQLIADNLMELFIENHEAIKYIFSSDLTLSKKTLEYQNEFIFKIDFMYYRRMEKSIYSDVYESLVQYNNAFYSMAASSVGLHQSNIEIYNFNHNGNQDFELAKTILYNIYYLEFTTIKKNIIKIGIVLLILCLLIFILIYYFSIYYFLSANRKAFNYLKLIYGINENFIKKSLLKCQNLINKLNHFKDNLSNKKEDESNIELESKMDEININKKSNSNKRSFVNNKDDNIIYKNMKFLVSYSLFFIIIYVYFIYFFIYIIRLTKKTKLMIEFFSRLKNFQLNIIDIFNSYRQYVFDEEASAQLNVLIYDTLHMTLVNSYDTLTLDVQYITDYILANIPMEGEMLELFSRSLCSYYITDTFNSTEDCLNKYGSLINNDFSIFAAHFLEDIRILKNLVRYIINTGKYRGRLNIFRPDLFLADELIPKKSNTPPNTDTEYKFRLDLFNNETIHNNLNSLFLDVILPYLNMNRKLILKHVSLKGDEFNFIFYSILYIIFLLIFFFCCWLPIISQLNKNICETKNILSIIPIDILLYDNDVNIFSRI